MSAFDELREKCQKQYVTRKELWNLTGGIIHPRNMARFDREETGIRNSVIIGHKRVYPIDDVTEWLKTNSRY
jgi:hypothetical protein